jgi:hypothetical protein
MLLLMLSLGRLATKIILARQGPFRALVNGNSAVRNVAVPSNGVAACSFGWWLMAGAGLF